MLQFLGDGDTWRMLRSVGRSRNVPLYGAAPFLGDGGGKLLPFKRGDVLVVALTEANARNGSVCPAEIRRLQSKGVKVFLSPDLHAKVFLCGARAIVGSTNLSRTSFEHLDEAAILTNERRVTKHIRAWFHQRMLEPVTPEWLAVCAKAYRPPRGNIVGYQRAKRRNMGRAVWLLGIEFHDYPENEATIHNRGLLQARQRLTDTKRFTVETIRWTGKYVCSFQKGDTVIQIIQSGRSHYAEELARLIGLRSTKSAKGRPVAYLYLECYKRPIRISWQSLKRECAAYGLNLGNKVGIRQLSNPAQAAKVMALVSRR